jgi:hypothetical protein
MTHAEFEQEPVQAVRWMLEIDRLKQAIARERKQQRQIEGLM